MKNFRRSHDKSKDGGPAAAHTPSAGIPSLSKPSASIQPPKKVIRAKESHVSTSPQELPFNKGDFFYVVGERDDPRGGPGYYEALNTMSNARGLVSKAKFEEFGRSGAHSSKGSISDPRSSLSSSHSGPSRSPVSKAAPRKELYGKMMYDFVAERDDELSAMKDEPVLIQAVSTADWFVAKKIVTVSKPGLIPVSFVEILDPATGQPHEDVPRLLRECALPDVKEWREKTESYASSVIPLGRIDDGALAQGVPNSPYANYQTSSAPSSAPFQAQQQRAMDDQYRSRGQQQHQRQPSSQQYPPQHQHQRGPSVSQQQQPSRQHASQPSMSRSVQSDPSEGMLPPGTFSSACVVSFHQEKVDGQQEYFFRIHAVFLPDDPAEKASRLILFRTYDHFYRFQIDLLDTFPAEAGRVDPDNPSAPPPRRILPYMPGPLDEVDDSITHERRSELDGYIRFLIALHRIKADYVLSSSLVRTFFFAGQSDGNSPIAREVAERELAAERAQDPLVDLEEGIEGMGLGGSEEGGSSQHHDHPAASSSSRQQQQQPQQQQRLSRSSASGGQPSSSAHQRGPSHSTHSLAQSNGSSHTHGGGRNTSPLPPIDTTNIRRTPYSASNGLSGGSRPTSHDYLPSATATSSSWGSNAGGGVLNSGFSPMTPAPLAATSSGSAHGGGGGQSHGSGPTAAYKKIKIYDSTTDDVMAIRVPPNVTFDQLSQKVQDRLGGGRRVLSFRDSVGSGKGASRGIEDDRDLLDWMSRTDKLVLYAD